jgi:hypothetical protein
MKPKLNRFFRGFSAFNEAAIPYPKSALQSCGATSQERWSPFVSSVTRKYHELWHPLSIEQASALKAIAPNSQAWHGSSFQCRIEGKLMTILRTIRSGVIALCLALTVLTLTACGGAPQATRPMLSPNTTYSQLERGDTASGQRYGDWVVQTANGLIQDAYVRDNDKLGVVISPKVRPNEVRSLAKSLMQGFHTSFPDRNLDVLVYAPDKELILSANYNNTTRQIEYQTPRS